MAARANPVSQHAIPQLAAQVFGQRQRAAQRAVAAGHFTRDQAEAKLAPWAALALECGADVPVLNQLLEGWRCIIGDPLTEADKRWIAAREFCARDEMLAELARATAAAIEADWRGANARALLPLYLHFPSAPPLYPEASGMTAQRALAGPITKEAA